MSRWLSIAPTWWELLQSIAKQGYVFIKWNGTILKQPIENRGSADWPHLHLEYELTYPIRLIERDYRTTWSKNREDLE